MASFNWVKYEEICLDTLVQLLDKEKCNNSTIVDIGASYNSYFLHLPYTGLLIDSDAEKIQRMITSQIGNQYTKLALKITPENVVNVLNHYQIPRNFLCLNLDIDGYDLSVLINLLKVFQPQIIQTEINEKIPYPIKFSIKWNPKYQWKENHMYGYSLACLKDVMLRFGYSIYSLNMNNVILVRDDNVFSKNIDLELKGWYEKGYLHHPKIPIPPWNLDLQHLQQSQDLEEIEKLWRQYFIDKGQKDELDKYVMNQECEKYLCHLFSKNV